MQFKKTVFLGFQITIFLKSNSQTVHFLRFGLKLHFLSTKSQSQTHP